ncbi:MAG: hypothetical protein AABZ47_01060 [Planctomycetota bacterium]
METNRVETTSSTFGKVDANREPNTCVPCATAPATGPVATTGRVKGEAIGGAIGHAMGVGADVVAGAVAGGIAAVKNAADKIAIKPVDPTAEHEFWRKEFVNRPYFTHGTPYEQYGSAFQFGWESFANHKGKTFNDVEAQLSRDWDSHRKQSKLSWNHAKDATRDAWHRVEKAACGDSCGCA